MTSGDAVVGGVKGREGMGRENRQRAPYCTTWRCHRGASDQPDAKWVRRAPTGKSGMGWVRGDPATPGGAGGVGARAVVSVSFGEGASRGASPSRG